MLTDTIVEDDRWSDLDIETLAEGASRATLGHLDLDPAQFEIAVLACDDTRIATLNAEFRAKPTPTNVLSWPSWDLSAETEGDAPEEAPEADGEPESLGDIAISWDTCEREAKESGKLLADHATHLIIHGVLHLLGYDHVRDGDATLMEGHETAILGKMGIDDPYRDH
ncbi:rRNA maturation RNase YbeY [Puniceibacterium sediminis]|uniref:Endoribonuclease YbeY n=1 Tax=Puniceibacterium sediminis TaxID=1608407 RepID=A0A238VGH8_9RHOB|nr:rRNA maturation RNase YbeY [Puniceibacterium sediminis]SNR33505.1 probable rRNA maturation factor [Puniceibacterium sediminis]